eukprot:11648103-Ditylum_brightwellii.AAC.1
MQYSNSKLLAWYSTSIVMHCTCQQKKRAAKQEDLFISVRHWQTKKTTSNATTAKWTSAHSVR